MDTLIPPGPKELVEAHIVTDAWFIVSGLQNLSSRINSTQVKMS